MISEQLSFVLLPRIRVRLVDSVIQQDNDLNYRILNKLLLTVPFAVPFIRSDEQSAVALR